MYCGFVDVSVEAVVLFEMCAVRRTASTCEPGKLVVFWPPYKFYNLISGEKESSNKTQSK